MFLNLLHLYASTITYSYNQQPGNSNLRTSKMETQEYFAVESKLPKIVEKLDDSDIMLNESIEKYYNKKIKVGERVHFEFIDMNGKNKQYGVLLKNNIIKSISKEEENEHEDLNPIKSSHVSKKDFRERKYRPKDRNKKRINYSITNDNLSFNKKKPLNDDKYNAGFKASPDFELYDFSQIPFNFFPKDTDNKYITDFIEKINISKNKHSLQICLLYAFDDFFDNNVAKKIYDRSFYTYIQEFLRFYYLKINGTESFTSKIHKLTTHKVKKLSSYIITISNFDEFYFENTKKKFSKSSNGIKEKNFSNEVSNYLDLIGREQILSFFLYREVILNISTIEYNDQDIITTTLKNMSILKKFYKDLYYFSLQRVNSFIEILCETQQNRNKKIKKQDFKVKADFSVELENKHLNYTTHAFYENLSEKRKAEFLLLQVKFFINEGVFKLDFNEIISKNYHDSTDFKNYYNNLKNKRSVIKRLNVSEGYSTIDLLSFLYYERLEILAEYSSTSGIFEVNRSKISKFLSAAGNKNGKNAKSKYKLEQCNFNITKSKNSIEDKTSDEKQILNSDIVMKIYGLVIFFYSICYIIKFLIKI